MPIDSTCLDWISAIGGGLGGIGAAVAAIYANRISSAVRREQNERLAAEQRATDARLYTAADIARRVIKSADGRLSPAKGVGLLDHALDLLCAADTARRVLDVTLATASDPKVADAIATAATNLHYIATHISSVALRRQSDDAIRHDYDEWLKTMGRAFHRLNDACAILRPELPATPSPWPLKVIPDVR